MTAPKRKALRSRANGQLFPMNEQIAKHPDTEVVYIDDKGRVIEPEEIGPAAAMPLPNPEPDSVEPVTEDVTTTAEDVAAAVEAAAAEAEGRTSVQDDTHQESDKPVEKSSGRASTRRRSS